MSATLESPVPPQAAARSEPVAAVEWPTLGLALAVYGAWLALTYAYGHMPLAVVAPLLTLVITLHSSLQHEIIHGHPTRRDGVNRVLGMVPLSLWLPFERYRAEHLQHHEDDRLTDPFDDPESYYWTAEQWQGLHPAARLLLRAQQTLAGRVLLGSFCRPAMFLWGQVRGLLRNEPGLRALWTEHLLWCVPLILWLEFACGMPLWLYVCGMVVPANGLLLIRSFAEHRAVREPRKRVAIVEGSWFFGPLFLFNNLHALHHEAPMIPWYRYNRRYREQRARLVAENGGLVYAGYADVARRFLFKAHDSPLHPTGRAPSHSAR